MRTTRLYLTNSPDELSAGVTGNIPPVTLNADASRYLSKVMRYKVDDTVVLFNGDGNNYNARIISINKTVQVQIDSVDKNETESPLSITLVQSLAKGTKLELIIQKATELGVVKVSPVTTERTVLQIDQKRMQKKLEHWSKIAQSACAQCNRSVVPIIEPVLDFKQWLSVHAGEHSLLIQPGATETFADLNSKTAINILVGPEGGFSDAELALAIEAGVNTVRCGPRVMRTETAGLVATAIVQSLMGDLG